MNKFNNGYRKKKYQKNGVRVKKIKKKNRVGVKVLYTLQSIFFSIGYILLNKFNNFSKLLIKFSNIIEKKNLFNNIIEFNQ